MMTYKLIKYFEHMIKSYLKLTTSKKKKVKKMDAVTKEYECKY